MRFKPIDAMMHSNIVGIHNFGHYLAYQYRYRSMLFSIVKKDFKGKYRHSALGYLWHLITPLALILIYYVVFNFSFGRDIPDYWLYLSSAVFALNFFSASMSGGSTVITGNSGMVTKMQFPREILVFSMVLVNLITAVISYTILLTIMICTGISLSFNLLLIPIILILETMFAVGVGLLLGSLNVYYRDISNGVHIVTMCLYFVTPCFYMVDSMSPFMQSVVAVNPLAYYVETIHDIMYFGIAPGLFGFIMCILIALVFFIIGLYIFKKLEKGFAERM